ncbi:MAG: serine/threonine-protein kinase [Myxococcota bacterium]
MRTLTFNRVIQDDSLGTVYHAALSGTADPGRACAAKVIAHATPDQEHFRARMRDAARLLPMIQHPRLLGVRELVHMEGHDAVLMDYVQGVDLGRLLAEGPVPPGVLARIGAEVAEVLHHAHQATDPGSGRDLEFVHRDVKPDNIVIGNDGVIYLMDFGVARAAFEARESVTQGLVLGTLFYFAPEILSGKPATSAADIYGLGLSMWEAAMAKRWGQPQVHPNRFAEQVDDNLDSLKPGYRPLRDPLLGMLQWDPRERPAAGTLSEQLRTIAQRLGGPSVAEWAEEVVAPLVAMDQLRRRGDPRLGQTVAVTESVAAPTGSATPTPVPLDEPSELLPRGGATLLAASASAPPRTAAASPRSLASTVPTAALLSGEVEVVRRTPKRLVIAVAMGILATSCTVMSLVAAVVALISR